MSLLVGLLGANGMVLATDSRATFGDPRGVTAQNDLITKLYLVNDRVGVMVAGAGDLGSTVVSGFLALPDIATLGVTELTMALHRYAREQFGKWFQLFSIKPGNDSRTARPDLSFIVAGFELNQEAKIYRMSSSLDFAPMLHSYGFGIDGVAQYALYLLNRLYDSRAAIEELQYLAAYVITETASQDGKVGGPIQIATIVAGKSRFLSGEAVESILNENRERSLALKESFFKKRYVQVCAEGSKGKLGSHRQATFGEVYSTESVSASSEVAEPVMDALSTGAKDATEEYPSDMSW